MASINNVKIKIIYIHVNECYKHEDKPKRGYMT